MGCAAGYLVSPVLLARFDCRTVNIANYAVMAGCMAGLATSFLWPHTLGSSLALPCLVGAGANYGLGVGPVPNVLMSSLFTQKTKSVGSAIALTFKVGVVMDNFCFLNIYIPNWPVQKPKLVS